MELPPRISSNYERKLLTGGEKRVSDLDGWFPTWMVGFRPGLWQFPTWLVTTSDLAGDKRVAVFLWQFPTWLVTISDLAGDQRVAVFLTWLVGEKQVSDLPGDKWVADSDLVDDKRASDLAGNFFWSPWSNWKEQMSAKERKLSWWRLESQESFGILHCRPGWRKASSSLRERMDIG